MAQERPQLPSPRYHEEFPKRRRPLLEPTQTGLLIAAGFAAGAINILAGGGSLLSVPLLVALGLPGDVANGTNRIGIVFQSAVATWRFKKAGLSSWSYTWPLLLPIGTGAALGALGISQLRGQEFERIFGVAMLILLIPTLRSAQKNTVSRPSWSPGTRTLIFFLIGLYGGAIQAGVGLILMLALARSGYDLVVVNSIKVIVIGLLTAIAVPVFIFQGQVAWLPALWLTIGFSAGGAVAVRWTLAGGERLIRIALVIAVLALAGRMLGLY